MAEEDKTGKEDVGDADQTTGNEDVAADGQQGVTQDAAETQDEKYKAAVTMANAEKEKRQTAEAQTQLLREQMAVVQANPSQTQVQTTQPLTTYEQAIKDLGYDPEYITEPERIKAFARKDQLDQARNTQQANQFANQSFINAHSDYGEAVGKANLAGQMIPSAEITEILQRKPYLTAAAYASAEGAYKIVMDERKLKELAEKSGAEAEFENQQAIDAKTGVMSSSAVGGSGAVAGGKLPPATTQEQQEDNDRRVAAGEFD